MKNRIILNQADFSANNIGRVYEVGDFTKKVLAKQTQYTVEDAEAAALDTFLGQLTADGYIGGDNPLLDTLIIPGLASSHSELLYNIAHLDENGYPTDDMYSAEASAEASQQTYRPVISDNKIIALQRYADNNMTSVIAKGQMPCYTFRKNTSGQNFKSFSIIFYSHKTINTGYADDIVGSNVFRIRRIYSAFKDGGTYAQLYNRLEYTALGKFNIIGYDLSTNTLKATIDGVESSVEVNEQAKYNSNPPVAWYAWGAGSDSFFPEASIIAVGTYLNPTQCATLKGYVETFLEAIHATI